MERFSSLVTKSRPWPVIGRTIFFTSDKNRTTRDEIYFIDFWRENLSMYRIKQVAANNIHIIYRMQCFVQNALERIMSNTLISHRSIREFNSLKANQISEVHTSSQEGLRCSENNQESS